MENKYICEGVGCIQIAEFIDPFDNKLCSDCINQDVETAEYNWDECEAITYTQSNKSLHSERSNASRKVSTTASGELNH